MFKVMIVLLLPLFLSGCEAVWSGSFIAGGNCYKIALIDNDPIATEGDHVAYPLAAYQVPCE